MFLMGGEIAHFILQVLVFYLPIKEESQVDVSIARQLDSLILCITGVVNLVVLGKALEDFFISDTRLLLHIQVNGLLHAGG